MYNNQNRQNPNYVRRNNNGNGYVNQPNPNQNPNYPYQNGNYANGNYGNGNNGYVPQMMPNPNYNPNFNQPVMANQVNQPIQPMANTSIQQVVPIAPAPPIKTGSENAISNYLNEVTGFCTQLNSGTVKMLPKNLSVKEAVEIIMVADRLQVSRVDALKCWDVCSKGVVINPEFLESLFLSRKLITQAVVYASSKDSCKATIITSTTTVTSEANLKTNSVDNPIWEKDSELALREMALMLALRKAFPQLSMAIVSPVEVPNNYFTQAKTIVKKLYRKTVSFFRSCFAATDNNVNSVEVSNNNNISSCDNANNSNNINGSINTSNNRVTANAHTTNNVVENNVIETTSNIVESNGSKTVVSLEKSTGGIPKTIKLIPTKTNSIVEVEEDNFFLDLSELELKHKGKETSRIN
ncbi:MAG: hypothetical protein WAQ98_17645 [Blastocatellia bacterium]